MMKLSTKLVLNSALVTILCSGAIAIIVTSSVHSMLNQEMEQQVKAVMSGVGVQLFETIIKNDAIAAREILQGVVENMAGARFAFVDNFKGNVISHTLPYPLPETLAPTSGKRASNDEIPKIFNHEGRTLKIVTFPLVSEKSPRVVLAVDIQVIDAKVHRLVAIVVAIGLLITFAGIFLAAFTANMINRPLRRLATSLQQFGEGKDPVLLTHHGGEEIDQLYRVFNAMIDARRNAEKNLLESEERFRRVVEETQSLITQVDKNGCLTYVNPIACKFFGLVLEDCIGRNALDFVHQDDREETTRTLKSWIAERQADVTFANRQVSLSGEVRHFIWHSHLHYDQDGKLVVIDGIARDITDLKNSQEALVRKDALLSAMLRNLPFDFWARDSCERIIMQSDESIRLWGDLTGNAISTNPFDDLTIEKWKLNNCKILNGEIISEDCTLTTKSGEQREFHSIVSPIREGSKILGILGINIDITDHNRAEEERKSLQAQLIQAQKMEAIGTLAGGIAHDFNNILGAVIGYAELARDSSPSGSEVANDLDRVLEASHRAAALVKQILAFSRQGTMERVPLEPVHLVKEAIKLLRPVLPSTITIKQQLGNVTKPILADPTQMHQIVMNLCTNAVHAMEQTGGILDIGLNDCELSPKDLGNYPKVQPGKFVLLSIADSGPGISPEVQKKIFDPYFTTKETGKGSGMGLAIVHGILAASGGFVTCSSTIGKGTEFRVFFPAVDQEDISLPASKVEMIPKGRERILFIDDEEVLVDLGKTMLERLGYEVTIRSSSLDALVTFQNQPDRFDVVITDQTMPGMTGLDLARRMLQIRPGLPIILCTGFSTLVNEEQAKMYGIKGFTMKPIAKQDIAILIRKVLGDTEVAQLD